ncbi:Elongator subunit elp4 [Balamuthia mandrillaris]
MHQKKTTTTFTKFTRGGGGGVTRKGAKPTSIAPKLPDGTKPSVHNGQLLVSSGLHDLDEVIGGGIAVGTVFLLLEDKNTGHGRTLLKYFVSEGLSCRHGVLLAAADPTPDQLLRQLPSEATRESALLSEEEKKEHDLKIAWQYQKYLGGAKDDSTSGASSAASGSSAAPSKPTRSSASSLSPSPRKLRPFCHTFDLATPRKYEELPLTGQGEGQVCRLDINELPQQINDTSSHNLYQQVYHHIVQFAGASTPSPQPTAGGEAKPPTITRLALFSLGHPLWRLDTDNEKNEREMLCFLHALKGFLRSSLAVCFITIPQHLYSSSFLRKAAHACDTVTTIHSFKGSGDQVSTAYKDYSGLFDIIKLPRLNSLMTHLPDTLNYAFKVGRRKLSIEKLHLPPETVRDAQDEETTVISSKKVEVEKESGEVVPNPVSSLLCAPSAGRNNPLDF